MLKIYSILLAACFLISCTQENQKNGNQENKKEENATSDFTDSVFTAGIEGPATDKDGSIYAVNFGKEGTIGIVTASGKSGLYVVLPDSSVGNGIRFDSKGNMLVADYVRHNILRIDKDKNISVFAHGSTMNQPNDIAITKTDILFASDPKWSESTGKLWRISSDGKATLLEDSMGTTNGVEVGTSEKVLYVNESVQRKVWVYELSPEGNISNKRLLIEFPDHGMDGMRCDDEGNLYITRHGKGTVVIVSPEGKIIKEIQLKGKKPTNIAFGGPDGKTCYITMQDRGLIEVFRAEKAGREWKMFR
ncbi:MAG: SMP-30/gluconolactonase/LRE family protein [Cytophagaceae bacterium]|nr:SMP-30/gluconolactonase/LRE family protein [Cytophagaceae bacterium]